MKRLLLLLWLVSFDASAGVYKCQSADGKIKYQENPCLVDADARPLEIEQPPPEVLWRMQREERKLDLRQEAYRLKKIEWAQRDYQLRLHKARRNAINQSIAASIQMQENQEKAERRAGKRRKNSCRGHRSSISRCIRD